MFTLWCGPAVLLWEEGSGVVGKQLDPPGVVMGSLLDDQGVALGCPGLVTYCFLLHAQWNERCRHGAPQR